MGYWDKPNRHKFIKRFIDIPEGDHRVEIYDTKEKKFKIKKYIELTLKVSGYHGKLWHYIWYNKEDPMDNMMQRNEFFSSFEINENDRDNHKKWKGKRGAVRVYYKWEEDGTYLICVARCLKGIEKDNLPVWNDSYFPTHYDCLNNEEQDIEFWEL